MPTRPVESDASKFDAADAAMNGGISDQYDSQRLNVTRDGGDH